MVNAVFLCHTGVSTIDEYVLLDTWHHQMKLKTQGYKQITISLAAINPIQQVLGA